MICPQKSAETPPSNSINLNLNTSNCYCTVTRSDCTLDRREIAVKRTCPANKGRREHRPEFYKRALSFSPKDEDLHVNERNREQENTVADRYVSSGR